MTKRDFPKFWNLESDKKSQNTTSTVEAMGTGTGFPLVRNTIMAIMAITHYGHYCFLLIAIQVIEAVLVHHPVQTILPVGFRSMFPINYGPN